jgi:hypothetical protein
MDIIPADAECIVSADGTIVWSDAIFNEWFSHRGIGPGIKISKLFPGEKELCRPGLVLEDADRLGKRRFFSLECTPTFSTKGDKVSEKVRIRKITLQKVLTDISKLSTQTKTPKDLFEKVLWIMRDTTHYLAFAGYVVRDGRLELTASKGWTEKLKSYISVQDIAPDSTSVAGRTAYHRHQIVMEMKDYALLPTVKSAITKLGGEYLVVTPLLDQDKLVGVLTVIHDKILTPIDFEALQSICGQVAVVLNEKLLEENAVLRAEDAVLYANLIARGMGDEGAIVRAAAEGPIPPSSGAAAELIYALNYDAELKKMPLKDAIAYAMANAKEMAKAVHKKLNVKVSGADPVEVSPLFKYAFYEVLKNSVAHSTAAAVDVDVRFHKERSAAVRVEISDNGPGISDEFKSEVFRRHKANMKNPNGLGLYLVKKIANKYGGRVWIEDRVHGDYKKGTSVVITFPEK